jgi:hypothetical protein
MMCVPVSALLFCRLLAENLTALHGALLLRLMQNAGRVTRAVSVPAKRLPTGAFHLPRWLQPRASCETGKRLAWF